MSGFWIRSFFLLFVRLLNPQTSRAAALWWGGHFSRLHLLIVAHLKQMIPATIKILLILSATSAELTPRVCRLLAFLPPVHFLGANRERCSRLRPRYPRVHHFHVCSCHRLWLSCGPCVPTDLCARRPPHVSLVQCSKRRVRASARVRWPPNGFDGPFP